MIALLSSNPQALYLPNLITAPERLAGWTLNRVTVTDNAIPAPFGGGMADKITEDTTAAATHHIQSPSFSAVAGQTYTSILRAKAGERFYFSTIFGIASSPSVIVDLRTAAAVSGGTATNYRVRALPAGWVEIAITATATATGASVVQAYLRNELNAGPYNGDGTSGAYVWGFQVVRGSNIPAYRAT